MKTPVRYMVEITNGGSLLKEVVNHEGLCFFIWHCRVLTSGRRQIIEVLFDIEAVCERL